MNWLFWLVLTVILTAVVAITGMQPKRTRPVAGTQMIGVARVLVVAVVLIFAYAAFRARAGG